MDEFEKSLTRDVLGRVYAEYSLLLEGYVDIDLLVQNGELPAEEALQLLRTHYFPFILKFAMTATDEKMQLIDDYLPEIKQAFNDVRNSVNGAN